MKYIKKLFIIVLAFLMLNLYLPKLSLAQQVDASAEVPKHEPQSWGTEEDIPTIKKKRSGWTWVILLALIGGVAAAASSGGGDGGGGGSSGAGDDGDTGSYTGTW
jgi:hypothetical protein